MSFGCHRFSKINNEKFDKFLPYNLKSGQINEVKALSYKNMIFTYDYMGYLMYYSAFILWFDHFLDSGPEICQIFRWFFGKFKKNHKDILKLTDLYIQS
jgi:hypothetical protein